MRTFILDIIPRIKRFSERLDVTTKLSNKHWIVIDYELKKKVVFIFREKNNQLLISENGSIEKGNWEYLGNDSLLIDKSDGSYLFKQGFMDDYVLALKVDGKEEYALLVNEQKFLNNPISVDSVIAYLNDTYIEHKRKKLITIPESPDQIRERRINTETKGKSLKPKESFSPDQYPNLDEEIRLIREKLKGLKNDFAAEIIISFARDHSIKGSWAKENPELVDMVVNSRIPIASLKQLFRKSKNNYNFRKDFEKYLLEELKR